MTNGAVYDFLRMHQGSEANNENFVGFIHILLVNHKGDLAFHPNIGLWRVNCPSCRSQDQPFFDKGNRSSDQGQYDTDYSILVAREDQ